MPPEPFPKLINEYKYTLIRRRLLQTITGGVRVQTMPISLHIIQWLLWLFPLAVSVPFIACVNFWNVYYIGLIYSIICGLSTLFVGCTVKILFWKFRNDSVSNTDHVDDEQDNVIFPSIFSIASLSFIFSKKNWMDVIIHAIFSSLTCYSSLIILNVYTMVEVTTIPATVFVLIIGSITLSTAHYSLLVKPPNEISLYRQHHHDKLHLFYLTRPVYVILVGIIFILLRNLQESRSFLIIPYVIYSLLPLLWTTSLLPPLDALIFWIIEQTVVHLMGGSATASELRLLIQGLLALLPAIGLIWIKDRFVLLLMAIALGFFLSQNIVDRIFRLLILSVGFIRCGRRSLVNNYWYTSYYIVDFRLIQTWMQAAINLLIKSLINITQLTITIVIASQTINYSINDRLVNTLLSCVVILTFLLTQVTRIFAGVFCCGLVRNPFHPRKIQPGNTGNRKKAILLYLSIPSQMLILYAAPLIMITYVSLVIDLNISFSNIWFTVTSVRLYRKIWQNSSSCLTDLTVIAIISFFIPTESHWWYRLGIGSQALVISFMINFGTNILKRLKFFTLLLISFTANCSFNNRVFCVSLVLSLVLIPFSLFSIILSSLLSSPLIPVFTLPIFITTFPRPRTIWPTLLNPTSLSQTYESSYYKQALPAISKSISQTLRTGTLNNINPGAMFLIRFQDRLVITRVVEKGYGYCMILIQGLELQETSCHTTEALSIDEMFETVYSSSNVQSTCMSWFNSYPLYHLQPIDFLIGQVYSDAHNSLTGIINAHDSLQKFSKNLYKTLVWVFANHIAKNQDAVVGIDSDSNSMSSSIISPSHVIYTSATCRSTKIHPTASPATIKLPTSVPFTIAQLSTVSSVSFPNEWFNSVFEDAKIVTNQEIIDHLKSLITSCYTLTDIPASSTVFKTSLSSQTQPGHIYKGYCGDFYTPIGMHANKCKKWMKEHPLVKELTKKAYKYAVKLLYDEAVFGEVTCNTELIETLENYDVNWYIGQEEQTGDWERNVIEEKRSLFSIGYSENSYTAHVLTLQDELLYTGLLDQSIVEGIWTNLSFEIQYLTNDDEERYSIQAQPRLLRNLITQAAELPYGYQIYSSDLITIPSI